MLSGQESADSLDGKLDLLLQKSLGCLRLTLVESVNVIGYRSPREHAGQEEEGSQQISNRHCTSARPTEVKLRASYRSLGRLL